eukprot:2719142-Prymnesium_polylepis.1
MRKLAVARVPSEPALGAADVLLMEAVPRGCFDVHQKERRAWKQLCDDVLAARDETGRGVAQPHQQAGGDVFIGGDARRHADRRRVLHAGCETAGRRVRRAGGGGRGH